MIRILKHWPIEQIRIDSRMDEIMEELFFCLPEAKQATGTLIFEEVYTNIAKYAYEEINKDSKASIRLLIEGNDCTFVFEDYGCEFDMTTYEPSEINPLQIGGHGIRLIKSLSKNIRYKRLANKKNRLIINF